MALNSLRTDERLGLGIAVVLHVALVAALVLQPENDTAAPLPERMTVTLSTEVSLADTAPDPVPVSRAAVAPVISDAPQPAPPVEKPAELIPAPQLVVAPAPPVPRLRPDRQVQPKPAPAKTAAKPAPAKPAPVKSAQAKPSPAKASSAKAAPAKAAPAKPAAAKPATGSRIGADFLPGAGDNTTTKETRVPASQIGASAKASLAQSIARQLKPHWNAPQGADAEQLVTILAFNLNQDGSLSGRPRVVSQSGVTDSNSPQKDLHAERAIRAVQLAAPFDLPPEYYEAWKRVTSFRFDRKL